MIDQGLKSKSKHIDSFLRKEPKVLKKLDEMVEQTNEFALKQHLFYNLLRLTSDVQTFRTDLVGYLANDVKLAKAIVKKAKQMSKRNTSLFLTTKITRSDLRKSIEDIGYGAVHNELQAHYAKQYIDLYNSRKEAELKQQVKKSVRMAFLAVEIAKLVKYKDITSVFFAAMNYHIGEMVLFMRDQKRYHEYKKLVQKGLAEKTAELVSFGFDLGELASKMLTRWQMPEHITDVIANKENPEEIRYENKQLNMILKFTSYMMKAMETKTASPKSLWSLASDYLEKFETKMDADEWQEAIKAIFIKVLETEYSLFKSI